jgi:diguanylate cyclase (GGDEF)-like protein
MWKAMWKRFNQVIDQTEAGRPNGRLFLLPRLLVLIGMHLVFVVSYSLAADLSVRSPSPNRWGEILVQGGFGVALILYVLRLVGAHRRQWRWGVMADLFGSGLLSIGYNLLVVVPDLVLTGPGSKTALGRIALYFSWSPFGMLGMLLIVIGLTVFISRYEEERSERRRLQALIQFTEQLSQQDEQKLLTRAAEQLQSLLDADSTVIYLWNDDDEVLVPAASCFNEPYDEGRREQLRSFRVPRNFGATGVVFETGRPHLTGNLRKDKYAKPIPGFPSQPNSGIFVPIGDERPIGVVRMTRAGIDQFDQADVDLAASFARQVHLVVQHARAMRELAALSITDHLTGLYNTRHLFTVLERELERAQRYGHPLALIMLDADGLKQVNDRLGHQQGDRHLRMLGDVLKQNLRSSDWAFRYAGDEFALLLPQTTASEASILGERLRAIVAKDCAIPALELTISVGVAAFPLHANTVEALVAAADAALYASKRAGKNRLTIAPYQNVAVSEMPPEVGEGSHI